MIKAELLELIANGENSGVEFKVNQQAFKAAVAREISRAPHEPMLSSTMRSQAHIGRKALSGI